MREREIERERERENVFKQTWVKEDDFFEIGKFPVVNIQNF